jgi:hypothetical protein
MSSPRAITFLLLLSSRTYAADLTLDRLTALAKTYFRDSTEIPMTVRITTLAPLIPAA